MLVVKVRFKMQLHERIASAQAALVIRSSRNSGRHLSLLRHRMTSAAQRWGGNRPARHRRVDGPIVPMPMLGETREEERVA
jgi:hypothetical protein